jgi:hypothetical protein
MTLSDANGPGAIDRVIESPREVEEQQMATQGGEMETDQETIEVVETDNVPTENPDQGGFNPIFLVLMVIALFVGLIYYFTRK